MRCALIVLSILFLPAVATGQSRVDRNKAFDTWAYQCRQDFLSDNNEANKLSLFNITLVQMCDCVALQTTSRLTDEDIQRMYVPQAVVIGAAAYGEARKLCIVMLGK